MLKNLLGRGLCLVGAHEGEWAPAPEQPCTQTRTCTRCQTVEQMVQHDFGDWYYVESGACETFRTCARCQTQETGIAHVWDEPVRLEGQCDVHQRCTRCGEAQALEPEHDLRWVPTDTPCLEVVCCIRCQLQDGRKRLQHIWGAWEFDEQQQRPIHACERCEQTGTEAVASAFPIAPVCDDATLTAAVDAFFGAATTGEQQALIQQNAQRFFSVSMDDFLQRSLEQFHSHASLGPALRSLWVLLRQAQQEGLAAAFESQAIDDFSALVQRLFEADTWRSKQRLLIQNPVLYDERLEFWWQALLQAAPESERAVVQAHAQLVQLCRAHGVLATLAELVAEEPLPPPPPPPPPEPDRDPRLVGNWQHVDAIFSGGFSMRTYIDLQLRADGRFFRRARHRGGSTFVDSMGHWAGFSSIDSGASPAESGQWFVLNGALYLQYDDGTQTRLASMEVHPGSLFFPSASRRLWKRV